MCPTFLLDLDGVSTTGVTGMAMAGDEIVACADGLLLRFSLLDGTATLQETPCRSIGSADGGAVVDDGYGSAIAFADSGAIDVGDRRPTPVWLVQGSRSVEAGGTVYSTWHAASTVDTYDLESGKSMDSLLLEKFDEWIWGLEVVDDELLVLTDGRGAGSGPHLASFDLVTGARIADTVIPTETGGLVRGLACERSK